MLVKSRHMFAIPWTSEFVQILLTLGIIHKNLSPSLLWLYYVLNSPVTIHTCYIQPLNKTHTFQTYFIFFHSCLCVHHTKWLITHIWSLVPFCHSFISLYIFGFANRVYLYITAFCEVNKKKKKKGKKGEKKKGKSFSIIRQSPFLS